MIELMTTKGKENGQKSLALLGVSLEKPECFLRTPVHWQFNINEIRRTEEIRLLPDCD